MKKCIVLILLCSVYQLFSCVGDQPCPQIFNQVVAPSMQPSEKKPLKQEKSFYDDLISAIQIESQKNLFLLIQSEGLKNSKVIPTKYTCFGENISPDIRWKWNSSTPTTVKSYAILITSDEWIGVNLGINPRAIPDESHWVVFNIPPTVFELKEGEKINGSNGTELRSYKGPRCNALTQNKTSPSTYAFTVYALDIILDSNTIQTKDDLVAAIQGHIIASNSIQKIYISEQK